MLDRPCANHLNVFSACAYRYLSNLNVDITLSTLRANSAMNVARAKRIVVLDSSASRSTCILTRDDHATIYDVFWGRRTVFPSAFMKLAFTHVR